MKKNTIFFQFTLIAFMITGSFTHAHEHGAHVHGIGKIALAIETSTQANIDLDVAGDSIMGFEHAATSPKDKKAKDDSFKKLAENGGTLLQFDPKLNCVVTNLKVEIEKEAVDLKETKAEKAAEAKEKHGEHSDVNASYTVKCASPLLGSKVQVGIFKLFPKIKSVKLEILSPTAQNQQEIKDAHTSITIP